MRQCVPNGLSDLEFAFRIFRRRSSSEAFRGGVAIGDQILDLAATCNSGVFSSLAAEGARAVAGTVVSAR